jgi:hypothetical protein
MLGQSIQEKMAVVVGGVAKLFVGEMVEAGKALLYSDSS